MSRLFSVALLISTGITYLCRDSSGQVFVFVVACITATLFAWKAHTLRLLLLSIIRVSNSVPESTFILVSALSLVASCGLISWCILQASPHHIDECAYIFQAKIFAAGMLTAPPPPLPEFFNLDNVIMTDDKWYSQYPPGFPLVLSIGQLLNVPWVINPLLSGLNLVLIYKIAKSITSAAVAKTAVGLAATSPLLLLLGSSYMSHILCTTSILAMCFFALEAGEKKRIYLSAMAGLCGAVGILVRPYTMLCVVWIIPVIMCIKHRQPRGWLVKHLIVYATFLSCGMDLLFLYNRLTNDEWFALGYTKQFGPETFIGFGETPFGPNEVHTVQTAVTHAKEQILQLNDSLLIGSGGLAAILLMGTIKRRMRRFSLCLCLPTLSLLVGHFVYFWNDTVYGPRLICEAAPFLIILSAYCLRELSFEEQIRSVKWLACAAGFAIGTGGAGFVHDLFGKYCVGFGGFDSAYESVVESKVREPTIAFVNPCNYASVMWLNDPRLQGNVIWCRDLESQNEHCLRVFGRPGIRSNGYNVAWLLEQTSATDATDTNTVWSIDLDSSNGLWQDGENVVEVTADAKEPWFSGGRYTEVMAYGSKEVSFKFPVSKTGEYCIALEYVTCREGGAAEIFIDDDYVARCNWKYFKTVKKLLNCGKVRMPQGWHLLRLKSSHRDIDIKHFGFDRLIGSEEAICSQN